MRSKVVGCVVKNVVEIYAAKSSYLCMYVCMMYMSRESQKCFYLISRGTVKSAVFGEVEWRINGGMGSKAKGIAWVIQSLDRCQDCTAVSQFMQIIPFRV
jgi:hypothetical protein